MGRTSCGRGYVCATTYSHRMWLLHVFKEQDNGRWVPQGQLCATQAEAYKQGERLKAEDSTVRHFAVTKASASVRRPVAG